MSGREQNNDSYKIGKGYQLKDRKKFNLENLKGTNDPEELGIPFMRTVKEDSQGNAIEIGKKEALNIFEPDRVVVAQGDTVKTIKPNDIKNCPHCGGELPS